MDLNTGRTYETRDEALAAGVPEKNLVDVREVLEGTGLPWPPRSKRPGEARNRKLRNRRRNRIAALSRRANR